MTKPRAIEIKTNDGLVFTVGIVPREYWNFSNVNSLYEKISGRKGGMSLFRLMFINMSQESHFFKGPNMPIVIIKDGVDCDEIWSISSKLAVYFSEKSKGGFNAFSIHTEVYNEINVYFK